MLIFQLKELISKKWFNYIITFRLWVGRMKLNMGKTKRMALNLKEEKWTQGYTLAGQLIKMLYYQKTDDKNKM